MRRWHYLSLRRHLFSTVGAAILMVGVGVSVYAAEPDVREPVPAAPNCGSIDPGFAYDLEDSLRGPRGSIDPGFAPQPIEEQPAANEGSIDPGFSRTIDSCPTDRLQDLLATPGDALISRGTAPSGTPVDNRRRVSDVARRFGDLQ
ncbi:MAG: hypothetical protein QOF01_4456 [Thermomicrobiales bacterium]|nr:hypothetical protein [Thermomicrobiales bacterium]